MVRIVAGDGTSRIDLLVFPSQFLIVCRSGDHFSQSLARLPLYSGCDRAFLWRADSLVSRCSIQLSLSIVTNTILPYSISHTISRCSFIPSHTSAGRLSSRQPLAQQSNASRTPASCARELLEKDGQGSHHTQPFRWTHRRDACCVSPRNALSHSFFVRQNL